MTRIIYGVSGEGAGHSSRAREMVPFLRSQGHDVRPVSYDRGYRVLDPLFGCMAIQGLHIVSVNNRVQRLRTVMHNLRRLPSAVPALRELNRLFREFRPEVVITDFEPATAWLARWHSVRLISLDNQHRMRYMQYETPDRLRVDRWMTETLIRLMIPSPDAALATTFFEGPVKNHKTFLFPPILRRDVLACRPQRGEHHLVYVTNHFDSLLDELKAFPQQQFIVYGQDCESQEGNLTFKKFSVEGFLQDLCSAQSVIATAGFTLISEAMFLGKPYLALPMKGQFEQQLNAVCLADLGYGMNGGEGGREVIAMFLDTIPDIACRLRDNPWCRPGAQAELHNQAICTKLQSLVELPGPLTCADCDSILDTRIP